VGFVIGIVIALGCILGGFAAMGGHLSVIWQPWEFVIIGGASLGTFIVANPMSTIKDTGRAMMEAILDRAPTQRHYLDVLGVLYTLMRELRGKGRNELEQHVDNPNESTIFKQTVWKRRRIEDGRAWWGFWLVFAIFCPKLLLILLALSGMR